MTHDAIKHQSANAKQDAATTWFGFVTSKASMDLGNMCRMDMNMSLKDMLGVGVIHTRDARESTLHEDTRCRLSKRR